jgi:predicted dinucleotide-binding enzyme
LKSLPAWNGRVLIDATNPFVETSPKLVLADLGGKGASEVVAALAPGARIVKAFNSIVTARFNEGPVKNGGRRVIFVSGDHPEPTAFIKQLIESFGFTAIDLGGLGTGGRLQRPGSARRSRPRRIRPSVAREAQNACSANQNFRGAGNRPQLTDLPEPPTPRRRC